MSNEKPLTVVVRIIQDNEEIFKNEIRGEKNNRLIGLDVARTLDDKIKSLIGVSGNFVIEINLTYKDENRVWKKEEVINLKKIAGDLEMYEFINKLVSAALWSMFMDIKVMIK